MTSSGHQPIAVEDPYIADMRDRYVDEGFSFVVDPSPDQLPPFLRDTHRPYAIARKPGERSIAIEVLQRRTPAGERSIEEIRRLFEGHADWRLVVVVTGRDPLQALTIPSASVGEIRSRIAEVRVLAAAGQHRAAFLLACTLLEAAFRRIKTVKHAHSWTMGSVVQALAMDGYLEPEVERRLYPLVALRNRIVHGDLGAEPSADEVEAVLAAVEQALDETDQLDATSSTDPSMASVAERNSRR